MTIVKWKLGLRVLLSALKMHAVEIEKTDQTCMYPQSFNVR